jgi:hypothetical protein
MRLPPGQDASLAGVTLTWPPYGPLGNGWAYQSRNRRELTAKPTPAPPRQRPPERQGVVGLPTHDAIIVHDSCAKVASIAPLTACKGVARIEPLAGNRREAHLTASLGGVLQGRPGVPGTGSSGQGLASL